jgi:hypothetical protein
MFDKGRSYSKGKTYEEVFGSEEAARKKARLSKLRIGAPPLHTRPHTADAKAKIAAKSKAAWQRRKGLFP